MCWSWPGERTGTCMAPTNLPDRRHPPTFCPCGSPGFRRGSFCRAGPARRIPPKKVRLKRSEQVPPTERLFAGAPRRRKCRAFPSSLKKPGKQAVSARRHTNDPLYKPLFIHRKRRFMPRAGGVDRSRRGMRIRGLGVTPKRCCSNGAGFLERRHWRGRRTSGHCSLRQCAARSWRSTARPPTCLQRLHLATLNFASSAGGQDQTILETKAVDNLSRGWLNASHRSSIGQQ
jgi:hypothetical protein